jgi:hypothetical protein
MNPAHGRKGKEDLARSGVAESLCMSLGVRLVKDFVNGEFCTSVWPFLWPLVQKTPPNDPNQHTGRMPEAEGNQQLPTCALSIQLS